MSRKAEKKERTMTTMHIQAGIIHGPHDSPTPVRVATLWPVLVKHPRQAKIDEFDSGGISTQSQHQVIRLNISMHDVETMNMFEG